MVHKEKVKDDKFAAIVLAGGQSKRFRSRRSKILHVLLGAPLIEYVVRALEAAGASPIGVVCQPRACQELVKLFGARITAIPQDPPLGTAHALLQAEPLLRDFRGDVCVVVGDGPLITPDFVAALWQTHRNGKYAATITTTRFKDTPPYGRVIRDSQGAILRIVEEKSATPDQLKISEVSTSHYFFKAELLYAYIHRIKNENIQGEYYLTDIVELLTRDGHPVGAHFEQDGTMLMGINTRRDFQMVWDEMNRRNQLVFLRKGVTIESASTTVIETGVDIGEDSIIHPFVYLARGTKIGKNCEIGPFVFLSGRALPDDSKIRGSPESSNKL